MLTVKRIIILVFVAVVLYFWVVSIFSEKNAPGRGGRYVYSNSLESEKRESDNTFGSFEKPAPPSGGPADGKNPAQPPGNEAGSNPNPPGGNGGQGPQPEPPKPPQPSAIPPEIPHPSPVPPAHVEVPHTPVPSEPTEGKGSGTPGGQPENPTPASSPGEQPASPMPGGSVAVPGEPEVKPETTPGNKAAPASEETKKLTAESIKKFDPKDVVLEDYFNQRLNIQIACPKNWTVIQSKTQPEFKCKSDDIEDLFFISRRSRIMEGRKFNDEIDAIVKNEIFGKDLQNKTTKVRAIGKYSLARITFDEYEVDSNEMKKMKNHLMYIFVESGDEVSMFYFVTPYKLKDKTVPMFEKIIKSIRIIKRPEPAGTK